MEQFGLMLSYDIFEQNKNVFIYKMAYHSQLMLNLH